MPLFFFDSFGRLLDLTKSGKQVLHAPCVLERRARAPELQGNTEHPNTLVDVVVFSSMHAF